LSVFKEEVILDRWKVRWEEGDRKMRGNWRQTYTDGYIWLYKGRLFLMNTEGTSAILFVGFPGGRLLRQTMSQVSKLSEGHTHVTLNTIFFARIVEAYISQILRPTLPSLSLNLLRAFISNNLLRLVWLVT
jgi:hypothetical protein